MINETVELPLFNPFSDSYEDGYCTFQLHFTGQHLESAELVEVVSKQDVSMMDFVPKDNREELEGVFVKGYRENMA